MRFSWMTTVCGCALLGIASVLLMAQAPRSSPLTYYVSQRAGDGLSAGNDAHTCEQARQKTTPRRSINRGIACLSGSDTLLIGPGTYDELLGSVQGSGPTCIPADAAAQPGCALYPNGLSQSQPTILKATGTETIISPVGRTWPGGGEAINNYDQARYIHIEGLRVVKHSAAGSRGGIYVGNSQHITIKGNTLDNGRIKSGVTSRYVTVVGNHIFNTGKDTCPPGVKPTPAECPHGMYICGTDHSITDNYVHDTSYYGIQVSCEQGGIARIRLERNRVERSPVVGIRCAGSDCFVAANVLISNGVGITVGGSGTVANNTIHDWFHPADAWGQDPSGISGGLGAFTVTNNIITHAKKASLAIWESHAPPLDASKAHHNMCDLQGNAGATLIAPATDIYTDLSALNFTLKPGSPAAKAGVSQGVTTDVRGQPYPTPPDLGAYSSSTTTPPPTGDTTTPQVSMTHPTAGSTVSGTDVYLEATASDNVGVVGVQLLVDGVDYQAEQRDPPYRGSWDTTTVTNGPHTLGARARDGAGLTSTTSITVTVANPLPPTPPHAPVLVCAGKVESGGALAFTCTKP